MNTTTPNLELAVEKVSKTRVKVTVRAGGEPMFVDTLNVSNAAARDKFVTAVTAKFPGIDPERLTTELLKVAALATSSPPVEPAQPQEVDIRRVVRPELFHTAEVSGITVLVVLDVGGKLVPRWRTYLRWADGRREVIDRPERVTLPDGGTLYVHPDPGEPPWSEPSGWSARSRQDWLAGASAPDPAAVFRRVCERIAYYLDFPSESAAGTAATVALWSMFSYLYPAWDARRGRVPRIAVPAGGPHPRRPPGRLAPRLGRAGGHHGV